MNKKYLMMFTAAALVMSSFSVSAEEKKELPPFDGAPHHERTDVRKDRRMPPNPEKMAEKLADDLGLTEAQREQAKQIRENGHKQVKPLMDQMRDIREKMDELRKENMEEFEKILTPEQQEKFAKIKEQMRPKHRGSGPRHDGPRPDLKTQPKK